MHCWQCHCQGQLPLVATDGTFSRGQLDGNRPTTPQVKTVALTLKTVALHHWCGWQLAAGSWAAAHETGGQIDHIITDLAAFINFHKRSPQLWGSAEQAQLLLHVPCLSQQSSAADVLFSQ
jgi:hypothetical protein